MTENPHTPPASRPKIRWFLRRDMPEVLDIENASFQSPWVEEEFLACLRQRNCIGEVATIDDKVVGFMIFDLSKRNLRLLNFAVAPDCRRQGIGRAMMECLQRRLKLDGQHEVTCEVRETNVPAQLLLEKSGFRAVSVLRNPYNGTSEDAYCMQYKAPHQKLAQDFLSALKHITGCEWSARDIQSADGARVNEKSHLEHIVFETEDALKAPAQALQDMKKVGWYHEDGSHQARISKPGNKLYLKASNFYARPDNKRLEDIKEADERNHVYRAFKSIALNEKVVLL